MLSIVYDIDKADKLSIEKHLLICSKLFVPPLETYVVIPEYADKLAKNAVTFEAWNNNQLVSLIACYLNDKTKNKGFISNVSTIPSFQGKGIISQLLQNLIDYANSENFKCLLLEVSKLNNRAISFYLQKGFKIDENLSTDNTYYMNLIIDGKNNEYSTGC